MTPFTHPTIKQIFPNWMGLVEIAVESYIKKHPTIAPNDAFSKNKLQQNPIFKWMQQCELKIVVKKGEYDYDGEAKDDIFMVENLDEFYNYLFENAKQYPEVTKTDKKVLAVDTETTGLSTQWKLIGGKFVTDTTIVGVPISFNSNLGFYIPTAHTEEDGLPNWDWDSEVKPFMQKVINNFELVFHNLAYDLAVLTNNGCTFIPDTLHDTLLISKMMNNQEFFPPFIGHGLKKLSEYVLGRKVLEINELMSNKDRVAFDLLPVVNAYTYAATDAIGTFGLFEEFVIKDTFGRNPYKYQKFAMRLMNKSVYYAVGSTGYGLPIDYDFLYNNTISMIIRQLRIETKFDAMLKRYEYQDIKITSPLIANFVVHIFQQNWKGETEELYKYIQDSFGMNRKVTTLKSGSVKEEFPLNDEVISQMKSSKKLDFLSDTSKKDINLLLDMLILYRTLNKDLASMVAILHSCFRDDRNIVITPIGLNIFGTDTHRFSNQKGKGAYPVYTQFKKLKTKDNAYLLFGNGITPALNSQGMPSTALKMQKGKKLKKVPTYIAEHYKKLKEEAEERLKNLISSNLTKK
jgi:hypothetical protein